MYWAGFEQAQMWKTFTEDGTIKYKFLETVTSIVPLYITRSVGGLLYFIGMLIMVYNLFKTAKSGSFIANEEAEAAALQKVEHKNEYWHSVIERKPILMLVLSLVLVLIGGILELVPTFLVKSNIPTIASVKPYTPLEVQGRDIYIREGCVGCHSQLIRPFRSETARYGEYSKSGEFVYDHPFLWGSKRTGPDLQRVGKKYPHSWHYHHMFEPSNMAPGSIMPAYAWLHEQVLDTSSTPSKINALRAVGVPYVAGYENTANQDLAKQAGEITDQLKAEGVTTSPDKEIIALIAYLQRLGTDIKMEKTTSSK
jgi:cytochrome c oxidase cbb3-type subunit I/II